MKTALDQKFEILANAFLAKHPEIRHEWRSVESRFQGNRTNLVCAPGAPNEVFATLHGAQIALGPADGDHEDFEDFGRGRSDDDVAREAFDRFVELLAEHGHLTRGV